MQKARRSLLITLVVLLCTSLSQENVKPDALELDTGRILKGRFESAVGETIQFRTSKGVQEVPRSQAVRLHFGRKDDLGAAEGKGDPRAQNEAAKRQLQSQQPAKQGGSIRVPAGTPITVRMESEIREGDPPGNFVSASVAGNVMIRGRVAIPVGSRVLGKVTGTSGQIRMEFTEINIWGESFPIHTTTQAGVTYSRRNTGRAGAAAGAAIGYGVDGNSGFWKGAVIGNIATRNMQDEGVVLEMNSIVEFRLNRPLDVKQP